VAAHEHGVGVDQQRLHRRLHAGGVASSNVLGAALLWQSRT
jgi:hypothetical protein